MEKIQNIEVSAIRVSPLNPRKTIDKDGLRELADNISQQGLLQPIIVRDGTGDLLVKSFEWDLYNDEIRIEATMLPVATLEVASETITSL